MSNLTAARLVGALWLISSLSYMIADEIMWGFWSLTDYLEHFYPNKDTVISVVLLEFINSATLVGMAIIIYPILKQYSERIAVTYVSFRVIEGVMLLVGAATLMSLVTLSKELIETSASNVDYIHTMATVLRNGRYVDFQLGMIPLSLCGLILCATFYRYRLIPRLLSGLGLVGYFALLLKILFDFYDVSLAGEYLYIPGAMFEMTAPFWLFVKGFNLSEKPKCSND